MMKGNVLCRTKSASTTPSFSVFKASPGGMPVAGFAAVLIWGADFVMAFPQAALVLNRENTILLPLKGKAFQIQRGFTISTVFPRDTYVDKFSRIEVLVFNDKGELVNIREIRPKDRPVKYLTK